jgi:hypothetical protein
MILSGYRVLAAGFLLFLGGCSRRDPAIVEYLKDKDAVVFAFLAPDCPLSQSYTLTLNKLRDQFRNDRIEFQGVFMSEAGVDDFVTTYKIAFPVSIDGDFRLAGHFGATVTPEVFLVDSSGKTLYKGAIDDGAPELGQHRTVVTQTFLLDALSHFVRHEEIRPDETRAVGCFIEKKTSG